MGIGGSARGIGDNMFVGLAGDRSGYMHKASLQLDYSAVTAACLMVKREIYEQAGGFEGSLQLRLMMWISVEGAQTREISCLRAACAGISL